MLRHMLINRYYVEFQVYTFECCLYAISSTHVYWMHCSNWSSFPVYVYIVDRNKDAYDIDILDAWMITINECMATRIVVISMVRCAQ